MKNFDIGPMHPRYNFTITMLYYLSQSEYQEEALLASYKSNENSAIPQGQFTAIVCDFTKYYIETNMILIVIWKTALQNCSTFTHCVLRQVMLMRKGFDFDKLCWGCNDEA